MNVHAQIKDTSEHISTQFGAPTDFDLNDALQILRRRKGVILGTMLLVSSVITLALFQLTPLYTSTSSILIDVRESRVMNVDAVLSGLPPDSAVIDSQVEILRSKSVAGAVVSELNLTSDPEFNKELNGEGSTWADALIPHFIANFFSLDGGPSANVESDRLVKMRVIDAFLDRLTVSRKGLTFVISVGFTSEDPAKATLISDTLASVYLLSQMEAKFEATRRASEWLNERLEDLRVKLFNSERAVEIYKSENGLIDSAGLTLNEQQLSELSGQLILIRAEKAEWKAKLERVQQLLKSGGGVDSVVEVLESQVITALRQNETELIRQQAELSARYGARHPKMIKVRAERRDLNNQINAEVRRITNNLENEVAVATSREEALASSLGELQNTAKSDGNASIRLRELQREADANRVLHESLLNRFKQTSAQENLNQADARIISKASFPLEASFPNVSIILSVSLILSTVLGLIIAFILEKLDAGYRTGEQLESELGLPHICSIPLLTSQDLLLEDAVVTPAEYIMKRPLSEYAEAFRVMRAALSLAFDKTSKVFMFTSALPNEGKTTCALSFSRAASESGLKTILIDCDFRRPSVHAAVGLEPKIGLIELLAGKSELSKVVRNDPETGLEVIPVYGKVVGSSEIFASTQMSKLIHRLREIYDLVVIDSAPVLPIVDSRILSKIVDQTVMVVQWEKTPRDATRRSIKLLRDFEADLGGVVFSQMNMKRQTYYGASESGQYYGGNDAYYLN